MVAVAEGDDVVAAGAGAQVASALVAEANPREVQLLVGAGHRLGKDQRRGQRRAKRHGGLLEEGAS